MSLSQSRIDTLRASLTRPNTTPRPILTSLNGDNSWLFSFPRPAADRKASGKAYFHVVSDAWLSGPSSEPSSWFSWLLQMEQPHKAAAPDGKAVEAIAAEIEDAAASAGLVPKGAGLLSVDAIFINAEAPDHFHEPTLRTFRSEIPVFAIPAVAKTVITWDYFQNVYPYHDLDPSDPNWRALHPGHPLPPWLTVFRLYNKHPVHWAAVIVYSPDETTNEALLWAPHGVPLDQPALTAFLTDTRPPIKVLGMLHAKFDNYLLWSRQTFGVEGGLALERLVKPKYWVKSHDTVLIYSGVVGRMLRNIPRTLQSALDKERVDGRDAKAEMPRFVEAENGGSVVLE